MAMLAELGNMRVLFNTDRISSGIQSVYLTEAIKQQKQQELYELP